MYYRSIIRSKKPVADLRVVSGKFKGYKLTNLTKINNSKELRPTTDQLRETLFNILTNGNLGDVVADARVLDLFAGTGALSIEAISRNAHSATLIDKNRNASNIIKKNIALIGNPANIFYRRLDSTKLPSNPDQPYTLVFLDPPYGKQLCLPALNSVKLNGWIEPCAIIVCEDNEPVAAPIGFQLIDMRTFGRTYLTLLRHVDLSKA